MSRIGRFLDRLNTGTVHFIRARYVKEDWTAYVHEGNLFMTKGTVVFCCGPCQQVIDRSFECKMNVGTVGDTNRA